MTVCKLFVDAMADEICHRYPLASLDIAHDVIAEVVSRQRLRCQDVVAAVSARLNVSVADIMTVDRGPQRVADARAICWKVIRSELRLSTPDIGDIFNRDHSTVLARVAVVESRADLLTVANEVAEGLRKQWRSKSV